MSKLQDPSKPLSQLIVSEFSSLLGSDRPSPGGGSAAALTAALGCALAEMVSRLNGKRKTNAEASQSSKNTISLESLRRDLENLMTEDAKAFESVSKLWKEKPPELQGLLKHAATVPLTIIEKSNKSLEIASHEITRTSKHLISDLAEAGILLFAAIKSARFNVEINLSAIDDKAFNQNTRSKVQDLVERSKTYSERLEKSFLGVV